MGARGGMIAPDQTTFDYIKGREFAPSEEELEDKIKHWQSLPSDTDAVFDKEYSFDADDIGPMITYGTNPGMGIGVQEQIPSSQNESFQKSLAYMGFDQGDTLKGLPINYVFIGSCTNSRIEDFRVASDYIKGKKKAKNVNALIVPGSQQVAKQIQDEGLSLIHI